jgi:hypothetical protein
MCRVAAKFVPRLLTDAQKENRVTVSQELFDRSNADEKFLKNVQSSQWMGKLSPRPKKGRQIRSNVKVNFIFFLYWKGILHYGFVPRGEKSIKSST